MICSTCGRVVEAAGATICPSCGQPLAYPSEPVAPLDAAPSPQGDSSQAETPNRVEVPVQASLSDATPAPESQTVPPDVTPIPYPNYGAPPYSIPPYGYPPYAPGYAAPPSQPLWPGYAPPPYGTYAPYPFSPYAPPLPQRRRRAWPWLAGVAAVVALVVIVCCTLGTVGALQRLASTPPAALSTVMPTPVATVGATPTPSPTPASVVLYQNTFTSDAIGWSNDSNCHLGAGGYHVTSAGCTAPVGTVSNVDIKAQVKQLSGPATYLFGFMLRIGTDGDKRYDVGINSVGQWVAYRCMGTNSDGKTANCKTIAGPGTNNAIRRGRGVSNTLEVRAKGTHFEVYVNGTRVGTFTNAVYSSGYVGLVTSVDTGAVFSNFSVSQLN